MDCIFCKIISKQVSSDILYEDDDIIAFKDLNPVSPVHFLVVPKMHIPCADDINSDNVSIISNIFKNIPIICKNSRISGGYRIVNNCGKKALQTVNHIHFHILGGRDFNWPPG